MSSGLVGIVTLCYLGVAADQFLRGAPWVALIWLGYAIANVGMIMGALK
jgi:hypothetical protein